MKKNFWKIEYSITLIVITAVVLFLLPTSFMSSKEALYISKWNETYTKIEYIYSAMVAQAEIDILKGLAKVQDPEEKIIMMKALVKPYMRLSESNILNKKYISKYLNGNIIKPKDKMYFDNLYFTESNMVVGLKTLEHYGNYNPSFIMMFDVNGIKPPNTWGIDIFGINIYPDGHIAPIGSGLNMNELKKDCSDSGSGVSCSYYYRIGGEFDE